MVWITTNNKSARAITETSVLLQSLFSVNLRAPSTRGLEESPCGAASSSRCSVARGAAWPFAAWPQQPSAGGARRHADVYSCARSDRADARLGIPARCAHDPSWDGLLSCALNE